MFGSSRKPVKKTNGHSDPNEMLGVVRELADQREQVRELAGRIGATLPAEMEDQVCELKRIEEQLVEKIRQHST